MVDARPMAVGSPPPPPPVSIPPKKDQEDLNIEAYKRVFDKCLIAAGHLVQDRVECQSSGVEHRALKVDIAKAIFDRFYEDQAALKAGSVQAKAMIDGLTSVLEGRR